MFCRNT